MAGPGQSGQEAKFGWLRCCNRTKKKTTTTTTTTRTVNTGVGAWPLLNFLRIKILCPEAGPDRKNSMDCESNLPIVVYFSGPGGKIWLAGALSDEKKGNNKNNNNTDG